MAARGKLIWQRRRRAKCAKRPASLTQLPQLNSQRQHEELRRLLPGYIRRFIEKAAPLVKIGIEGDLDSYFSFQPLNAGALDWLWSVLEAYPVEQRVSEAAPSEHRLTVYKPENRRDAIFLHPGESVFDRFREYVCGRFAQAALKGGVFIDANAQQPYLFHLALISVVRTDPTQRQSRKEMLESRIIGLKQSESEVVEAAPEYLTLLKEGEGIPPLATFLVAKTQECCEIAKAYALESVTQSLVVERRQALLDTLSEREGFLRRGTTIRKQNWQQEGRN